MEHLLDEYVQRAQSLPSFNVQTVTDNGEVQDWFEVTSDVARDLMVYEQGLGHQVSIIAGEINKWHRIQAQAKRVWQVRERKYRYWREKFVLELTNPDGRDKGWKKPTIAQCEAEYRTHPEYAVLQTAIEKAEEAYNACQGIVEGFRAKRDMLKTFVLSSRDGGAPKLSV